ncbi:hypothetical protein B0O99DRAFT_681435 [Bisporella sp. PMI_857]|nr:hypothetical protein B0O99DRAFT_681435 [Bisporella sp. PMI_857]
MPETHRQPEADPKKRPTTPPNQMIPEPTSPPGAPAGRNSRGEKALYELGEEEWKKFLRGGSTGKIPAQTSINTAVVFVPYTPGITKSIPRIRLQHLA